MTVQAHINAFRGATTALVEDFARTQTRLSDADRKQYFEEVSTVLAAMVVALVFNIAITHGKEPAFIAAFRILEKLHTAASNMNIIVGPKSKLTAAQIEDAKDTLEALAGVLSIGLEGAANFLKSYKKTVV